ncbi:MAG: outer membrane beta-barrel protein [Ginsengibacter sp.]
MQHLDDDMDDLFRRAAENYPLHGANEWEIVESQLAVTNAKITSLKYNPSKKNNIILSLFLLLFLSSAIIISIKLNVRQKEIVNPLNRHLSSKAPVIAGNGDKNKFEKLPVLTPHFFKEEVITHRNIIISKESMPSNKQNDDEERIVSMPSSLFVTNLFQTKLKSVVIALILTPLRPPTEFQNLSKNINPNEQSKAKKHSSFYLGVLAGVGLSKVGEMPVSSIDWNAGINGGYNFNARFTIETGISISTKYYNSAGTNFNMNKIKSSMPAEMVIEKLEGQTRLMEIPVRAFYNFYIQKQNKIFVSAGVSSYIIKKEFNHYYTKQNGQESIMTGFYKTENFVFPATFDFGAGWQHSISRSLDILIEPYLQLPLKGIGVGLLSVKSAGLHIGLLKHF